MKIAHVLWLMCLAMALVAADCRADDCGSWQEKGLSPDQAIDACARSIKSGKWTGGDQAANYNNRGNVWYYQGQYDKAISDYDKAIELNRGYAAAYYNRGSVWYAKGQHDEAISD